MVVKLMQSHRIPDAVYIGLQKTGSTFLRKYFQTHSNLSFTRHGKFFQRPESDPDTHSPESIRDRYADLFQSAPQVPCLIDMYEGIGMGYHLIGIADWSADVFLRGGAHLNADHVASDHGRLAARVEAACPDARIIMTIRSQPSWLYSNYRHFFEALSDDGHSLKDFLATLEGKLVLDAAMFDRIVETYDRLFGPERVHVLPMEMLESSEEAALRGLCHFLGVEYEPYRTKEKDYNKGRNIDELLKARQQDAPATGRLARLFSRGVRETTPSSPASDEKTLSLLSMVYAASNARLSARLGTDLGSLGYPL